MRAILIFLTITIVVLSIASVNCVLCKQYPKTDYSYNHTAAKNVTIDLSAYTIGDTPIKIIESPSDDIEILIQYLWHPDKVEFNGNSTDLNIVIIVEAYADNLHNGANIFIYLPDNASIQRLYRQHGCPRDMSVYKGNSQTTVGKFKGPIDLTINSQVYYSSLDA